MKIILVAGALANKYRNGGSVWERMSWVVGLRRLGFDVYFIERINRESCVDSAGNPTRFENSVNLDWFRTTIKAFGLEDRAGLLCDDRDQNFGISSVRLNELATHAELLVNLSGHLPLEPELMKIRRKAYIDVDPGFTQFWHADPQLSFQLSGHDFYFTLGENIGTSHCSIPTQGIHWRPTRQPVVLDQWPIVRISEHAKFTTIASWRGPYGAIEFAGRRLGLKVHEFRKFRELPRKLKYGFEIALDIHPADENDRMMLKENGWTLVNPQSIVSEADSFRRYVQQSSAEFSVAQGIYVETNCGWFSDRTLRYIASGKPALVQETGFSKHIPIGNGILTFRTMDEAILGANKIANDYENQCHSARQIAMKFFDSQEVLGRFLDEVGLMP